MSSLSPSGTSGLSPSGTSGLSLEVARVVCHLKWHEWSVTKCHEWSVTKWHEWSVTKWHEWSHQVAGVVYYQVAFASKLVVILHLIISLQYCDTIWVNAKQDNNVVAAVGVSLSSVAGGHHVERTLHHLWWNHFTSRCLQGTYIFLFILPQKMTLSSSYEF